MSDEPLVQVVIPPLTQEFTYQVPPELSDYDLIGYYVNVPFGRSFRQGFVVRYTKLNSKPEFELKNIRTLARSYRIIPQEMIRWLEWVAKYYQEPLSNVLDTAIPPLVPERREQWIAAWTIPEVLPKSTVEKQIIAFLASRRESFLLAELLQAIANGRAAVKRMQTKGLLKIEELPVPVTLEESVVDLEANLTLLPAQQSAVTAIEGSIKDGRFQPFLLHGVTGSGKTEVYFNLIEEALRCGRGALVLVPEIALTPQLTDRFRARLGERVAILHSGIHKRSRWDGWQALMDGGVNVALGARSAIFAPVKNLGVIIVDEEHDSSYKQAEGFRYHGRDLAVARAKEAQCPVILGSATPSLESWWNAGQQRYHYLSLPARPNAAAVLDVHVVDLNEVKPWQMKTKNVSPLLYEELKLVLSRGEQAFILYNRRGFATFLQCASCGEVSMCPNCSVTLTVHRKENVLLCHYCNYTVTPPELCATCLANPPPANPADGKKGELVGKMLERGGGTERVSEELSKLFPEVRLQRIDRDSISDIDQLRRIFEAVRRREIDFVVGTQMIAKGHDIPHVSLVGIVDCDVGLHMPDFRAAERGFQLLTQAAGRAGRAHTQGKVILQTRLPAHTAIVHTRTKDFRGFARAELALRKDLRYPPFRRLLRILASSAQQSLAQRALLELAEQIKLAIRRQEMEIEILGPAPAPIEKLKGKSRMHMLIKGNNAKDLVELLGLVKPLVKKRGDLRVIFDLDPQDML